MGLICFWRSADERAEVRRGLKDEYLKERSLQQARRDPLLERDLAATRAEQHGDSARRN